MKAEWLFLALNYVLGAGYATWVIAATALGVSARRRGDPSGRRGRWIRRTCWLGTIVGGVALAVGLLGSLTRDAPVAMGRLIWPGVVYPATALVVWIRLAR